MAIERESDGSKECEGEREECLCAARAHENKAIFDSECLTPSLLDRTDVMKRSKFWPVIWLKHCPRWKMRSRFSA